VAFLAGFIIPPTASKFALRFFHQSQNRRCPLGECDFLANAEFLYPVPARIRVGDASTDETKVRCFMNDLES
jgi:hypothetical protein